jgi:hypothetical protein
VVARSIDRVELTGLGFVVLGVGLHWGLVQDEGEGGGEGEGLVVY